MFDVKRMKKTLVFLLTLIMLFAMSTAAWAADVTVNFYDGTTKLWTTQTVDTNTAINARSQFYTPEQYPDATDPCGGKASVLDAIITAIDQINAERETKEESLLTFTTGWSPQTTTDGVVSPDGFYLDNIYVGVEDEEGYEAYATENDHTEGEDGEPNISYGYGWRGYNGATAFTKYLSSEELQDNMTINFKYEYYYYEW